MDCSTPGFPVFYYLPQYAQIHVHWVDDSIQPSHPLLPLFLQPSIFTSIRVFSNESVLCIRSPKYWSFRFSISPSNEYSGLISFKIDWFDLFALQGTLKGLLQHHSSKASFLPCSAFFMVQLSYLYMTTGDTIALSIWTFVTLNENECGSRPNHLYTNCFQKGYLLLNFLTWDNTYSRQHILFLLILNSLGSYLTTSLKFIFFP